MMSTMSASCRGAGSLLSRSRSRCSARWYGCTSNDRRPLRAPLGCASFPIKGKNAQGLFPREPGPGFGADTRRAFGLHLENGDRALIGLADVGGQRGRLLFAARVPRRIVRVHRQAAEEADARRGVDRSEEHTSDLQFLMHISYAVLRLKNTNSHPINTKQ